MDIPELDTKSRGGRGEEATGKPEDQIFFSTRTDYYKVLGLLTVETWSPLFSMFFQIPPKANKESLARERETEREMLFRSAKDTPISHKKCVYLKLVRTAKKIQTFPSSHHRLMLNAREHFARTHVLHFERGRGEKEKKKAAKKGIPKR